MATMREKQKAFIDEYLIDFNATQAAIRAGYSVDSAGAIGAENLKKPKIKAEIEKRIAERSRRTGITAERVMMEYAKIAFLNPYDLIDFSTGTIKEGASPDDLAAVAGVKVKKIKGETEIEEREIKLASKTQALAALYKYLGLDEVKVNINSDSQSEKMDNITAILEQMKAVKEKEVAGGEDE